jgi:hypothetical protein
MGQGDYKEDTFTDEEKAALGEAEAAPDAEKAEPEEKGPDTPDESKGEETPKEEAKTEPAAEPTAEEQAAAEDQGFRIETDEKGHTYIIDDDGTKIPPKRFREVYREAKEGERTKEKFDLFKKLGPEGYYQAFPDERPEAPPEPAPRREMIPPGTDIGALIVKQPNGPYDGMTLRDVYQQDPVFATNLQTDFLLKQREAEDQRRGEAGRVKQEAATEIETFAESVAQEVFGKSAKGLAKDEEAKVTDTIQQVIEWMHKTHRGGGNINDAYFLMNKEGLLKGAANKAAAKTIKDLQNRQGPASIDTGKGGEAKETGFEAMEKMTEEQLTAKIDKMSDKDASKFFKTAPKALRAKYPGLPWD